jgi:hypothetical protein
MKHKAACSLITPDEAPGLVEFTRSMHAAVREHVMAVTYTAQAKLMIPAFQTPNERFGGVREQRILALSRAISQATLALSRLPTPTEDGIMLAKRRPGAEPAASPVVERLIGSVVNVHQDDKTQPPERSLVQVLADEEAEFRRRIAPLLGAIDREELPGQTHHRPDWETRVDAERMASDAAARATSDHRDRAERMGEAAEADHHIDADRMDASAPEEAYSRPFGSSPNRILPPRSTQGPRVRVL